jgi:predicted phosphoribosyltransferase
MCKNQHTAKITVASPVASPRIKKELEELVDDIVVFETPTFFRAVAQVYENWYDVSDDEAKEIMNRWRKEHAT